MKKYILDLTVTENVRLHANYVLLKLTSPSPLPDMLPGQFAEIRVDGRGKRRGLSGYFGRVRAFLFPAGNGAGI